VATWLQVYHSNHSSQRARDRGARCPETCGHVWEPRFALLRLPLVLAKEARADVRKGAWGRCLGNVFGWSVVFLEEDMIPLILIHITGFSHFSSVQRASDMATSVGQHASVSHGHSRTDTHLSCPIRTGRTRRSSVIHDSLDGLMSTVDHGYVVNSAHGDHLWTSESTHCWPYLPGRQAAHDW